MLKYLKNDLISGFNVFLIALPLCLGIAIASNFPPSAGILTAIIGGTVASFFSGSKFAIKGPAAGLIAITLAAVEQLGGTDLQLGYERTLAVGVIAAFLQILIALTRKAVLAQIIPSSVIHGMLAAIGIIIVSKQSYVLMGLQPESSKPLEQLAALPFSCLQFNPLILLMGLIALTIVIFWPTLKKLSFIPASFIILFIIIPLSLVFNLNEVHHYEWMDKSYSVGPSLLINLPSKFLEAIHFPNFSDILGPTSLKFIILFTLIGSIESLLTVFAIDKLSAKKDSGESSDPNKDLLAIGIGNLVSAAIGGLPMISEIVRSKANMDFGAKTVKSNFFHGLFMLIAVLFLAKLINLIPLSALAAMLIFVGFKLSSPKEFYHAYKMGIDKFIVFCATLVITLMSDLLIGVVSGVILTIVFNTLKSQFFKKLFTLR